MFSFVIFGLIFHSIMLTDSTRKVDVKVNQGIIKINCITCKINVGEDTFLHYSHPSPFQVEAKSLHLSI